MARGWTAQDVTRHNLKQQMAAKPSKYKNVKTVVDGFTFDSKREASRYLFNKVREKNGEIRDLRCQVAFPLLAPVRHDSACAVVVAYYFADFVYEEQDASAAGLLPGKGWVEGWRLVIEDAKGKRTAIYALKRKWLELQDNYIIHEV